MSFAAGGTATTTTTTGAAATGGSDGEPIDTTPPSKPGTLTGRAVSYRQISLSWGASTDASGLRGYEVYARRGTTGEFKLKGTTPGSRTTLDDSTVFANQSYQYFVKAVDKAGNKSANSNTVTVKTPTQPSSTTGAAAASSSAGGSTSASSGSSTGAAATTGGSTTTTGGGTTTGGTSPIPETEEDIENLEDPAEVFGTTGDGEPDPEMVGKVTTANTSYKTVQVSLDNPDVVKAFIQYGLYENGLFNRTDEVAVDGATELELPDLIPGTRYFYQVVAENKDCLLYTSDAADD